MPAQPPRTRQWSDLATTDFATLDLHRAIAVLPLGATEQHGPHLPLSVDANLAHSMVQAATAHLPADLPALFLPVQRIGYSPEHAAFAGTLSLKADTVMRLWSDIAESVLASGVRKLVLFNTHGGNVGLMDVVARDWRARLGNKRSWARCSTKLPIKSRMRRCICRLPLWRRLAAYKLAC